MKCAEYFHMSELKRIRVALAAGDDGVHPDARQFGWFRCQHQTPAGSCDDDSNAAIRGFEFVAVIDENVGDFGKEDYTVWFLLFIAAESEKLTKKSLELFF